MLGVLVQKEAYDLITGQPVLLVVSVQNGGEQNLIEWQIDNEGTWETVLGATDTSYKLPPLYAEGSKRVRVLVRTGELEAVSKIMVANYVVLAPDGTDYIPRGVPQESAPQTYKLTATAVSTDTGLDFIDISSEPVGV